MTETVMTRWHYIQPGALIQDENGGEWRITERRESLPKIALWAVNSRNEGVWIVKDADHDVILIDESMSAAVATVQRVMPKATLLVEILPAGPDTKNVRRMWSAHLMNHHGIFANQNGNKSDETTLQGLKELHALEHASPTPGWVPHEHGRVA